MSYDDCLIVARTELLVARKKIDAELRDYPTPVSGCDAQYTHLVGLRRSVAEALRALEGPRFVATPRTLERSAGVESR